MSLPSDGEEEVVKVKDERFVEFGRASEEEASIRQGQSTLPIRLVRSSDSVRQRAGQLCRTHSSAPISGHDNRAIALLTFNHSAIEHRRPHLRKLAEICHNPGRLKRAHARPCLGSGSG